jgi:hypothetical protein
MYSQYVDSAPLSPCHKLEPTVEVVQVAIKYIVGRTKTICKVLFFPLVKSSVNFRGHLLDVYPKLYSENYFWLMRLGKI